MNQTITGVKGFSAAAIACGIKQSGKPDLALLVSEVPATAAAVFTQNKVVGAPIIVGRSHITSHTLRACIINSGCANVCTGAEGVQNAREMCLLTAQEICQEGEALPIRSILPSSTGVIGHFLPMDKIRAGIPLVAAQLSNSVAAGNAFANGILTTDLVAKTAFTTLRIGGKKVTIAGCCKGSGMIAPNMATMLAYIATDVKIAPAVLNKTLKQVADQTFNCVTVDQHTSTSDTFAVLANGLAGNTKITGGSALAQFAKALYEVADALARQIAQDGEGATKLVEIWVKGAASLADAKKAAEAIANSALCKTALHGADPNWGRFVSAAGYSGAAMNPDSVACCIFAPKGKSYVVFKAGRPTPVKLVDVAKLMQGKHVAVEVDLGLGKVHTARVYTCDLSREYIAINADYHT